MYLMKTDIGRQGASIQGLTDNEVIEVFNAEFGEDAAIEYFEFLSWNLRGLSSRNPMASTELIGREEVREFIETRLTLRKQAVC